MCGILLMAAGVVTIVLGLHLQHTCMVQQDKINRMDVTASVAQSSGYNDAAGAGYSVLIVGAGVASLGALADTPWRRNKRQIRGSSI